MLILNLRQGKNHVTLNVPPSPQPTVIRVSIEDLDKEARLGFVAPDAVLIMRSDARHVVRQSQSRMLARRRSMLRDER